MIVLALTPSDEANVVYTLLTRDLGVIRAKAQSIRKITSKLRYGLQYLSYGTVDIIRAKDYYRIVGVEPVGTLVPADIYHKPLHRITALVPRLLPQDEVIDGLYESVYGAYELLQKYTQTPYESIVEIITVARILALGGYWNESLPTYLESTLLAQEQLDQIMEKKQQYVHAINMALRHSHL